MAHPLPEDPRGGPSVRAGLRSISLLFAVRFDMMFGRLLGMFRGVNRMSMGEVCVVSGLFVVAFSVVPGGFVVVARSVFVMFRCLSVMLGCFLRHWESFRCCDFRLFRSHVDYGWAKPILGLQQSEFEMKIVRKAESCCGFGVQQLWNRYRPRSQPSRS